MEADGLLARSFGSAEEFLESGLQRKAACLIVDIRIPGMSGLELKAKFNSTWRCESADAWREGAAEFLVNRSTIRSYSAGFAPHSICEQPTGDTGKRGLVVEVFCEQLRSNSVR